MAVYAFTANGGSLVFANGWAINIDISAGSSSDKGVTTAEVSATKATTGETYDFDDHEIIADGERSFKNITIAVLLTYMTEIAALT